METNVNYIDIRIRKYRHARWRRARVDFPNNEVVAKSGARIKLGQFRNKGSNGTLFECVDETGARRAIKFLHQIDPQRISRFQFESQLLITLSHPHILRCIDIGQFQTPYDCSIPFFVTDLFEKNLETDLAKGPMSPPAVKNYAIQLCRALEYIHEQGVVHRDLKPSNIFLGWNKLVLGDFGIAKTSTDPGAALYYPVDVTYLTEFVGPILWLSPELANYSRSKDQIVDHRSDLFQLGLIIWYMLTRDIPRGTIDRTDDPAGGGFFDVVQDLLKQRPERRTSAATEVASRLLSIEL